MAVLDLLGRRWVLRIVWELRAGPLGFNELQARCDAMSPSVLNQRLADLRGAAVIEQAEGGGYVLTREGEQLLRALSALEAWSRRWAARMAAVARGGRRGPSVRAPRR
jgi:DNA-binding HxlR family transcriptional regulator